MSRSSSDDEDYQSRSRSRNRSTNRNKSKTKNTEDNEAEQRGIDDVEQNHVIKQENNSTDPEDIASQLSISFLRLFEKIKQRKGFILLPKQREALQNEQRKLQFKNKHHEKISWTDKSEWNSIEQDKKINLIFERQQLQLTYAQITSLKYIFRETSTLFGNETTQELYELFMQVIKTCLAYPHQSKARIKKLMVQELSNSTKYKFFNFKFSKIAEFKLKGNNDAAFQQLGMSLHRQFSLALYGKVQ